MLVHQLDLSVKGVKTHITNAQTATGIKDKVQELFMDRVIAWRQHLKSQPIHPSETTIQANITEWITPFHDEIINPYLRMPGWFILITHYSTKNAS